MTREEAINEINKVFTSAYANYIVTALTEGATVSDIQRRWGRAYEAGVKDRLEQEPCEDAVSRTEVLNLVRFNAFHVKSQIKAIENMPSVTPQEPFKPMVEIDLDYVIKQKYIEREVLDKIRAEIKAMSGDIETIADALQIIDKYKAESEET